MNATGPQGPLEPLVGRLPAPRLQLRWAQNNDPETFADYEWVCHYELVLPLRKHDIRREVCDDDGMMAREIDELVVPVKCPTKRGGNHLPCYDMLGNRYYDDPIRDGKHAEWDAEALGGLPIFVIDLDGKAIPKVTPNAGIQARP